MGDRIKFNLEYTTIIIFMGVFLYLGVANPWDNTLAHDFPYSYLASDAFFHQSVAQHTKDVGRYWFTPSYEVGGHKGVFEQHPPVLFEVTAAFSHLSGIEVYDSIFFIAVLSCLLFALIFYIIARQVNKYIAILSLPIMTLIFKGPFNVWMFWGYWMFVIGVLFMVASIWSATKIGLKHSYILIGIFLAGAMLSHQPELVFAVGYLTLFLVIDIIKNKKINIDYIKKVIFAGLISIPLSLFNMIIFSKTFLKSEGYRNVWDIKNVAALSGLPEMPWASLGIAGVITVIGLVLFFISNKKKTTIPASISLFSFLLGYLIIIGMGKRSYTHRFFWFIYASFFFGFALYYILKKIKASRLIYVSAITIILIFIISQPIFSQTNRGAGIMDPFNWGGLEWISKNTPEDSHIYYFFSNALAHNAPLYSSKRVSFNINTNKFIEDLQSGQIKRVYQFGLADSYSTYICKKSRFSFGYFRNHLKPKNDSNYKCETNRKKLEYAPIETTTKDICNIEYYYFNKASDPPALAQYNLAIRNILIQNNWITEVYNNQLVSILKNNQIGADCIENNTQ
jgi:hypothetical protein